MKPQNESPADIVKSLIPVKQSQFLLRRAHSLCGIIPFTVFVIFHLSVNNYSHRGAPGFNMVVDTLRGMPFITAISFCVLLLPFAFHILYGIFILFSGRIIPDTRQCHCRNAAYVLQRITAIVIALFLVYHIVYVKYILLKNNGTDYYALMRGMFDNTWVVLWYAIGLAAVAFHVANGLCTFCMTWGITVSRHSQRFMAIAMTVFGLGIYALGLSAMSGFILKPDVYQPAPKTPVITGQGTESTKP